MPRSRGAASSSSPRRVISRTGRIRGASSRCCASSCARPSRRDSTAFSSASACGAARRAAEPMSRPRGYVGPEYLDLHARLLDSSKERSYAFLHLEPGHRVLDLGCGPGTDTLALAALVGPTG